ELDILQGTAALLGASEHAFREIDGVNRTEVLRKKGQKWADAATQIGRDLALGIGEFPQSGQKRIAHFGPIGIDELLLVVARCPAPVIRLIGHRFFKIAVAATFRLRSSGQAQAEACGYNLAYPTTMFTSFLGTTMTLRMVLPST